MARRFIVRPLAEADLEDAAQWYEDERAGLAERFFSDVDRTFARIRERPLQFPAVSGEVRRALLHTFPTPFASSMVGAPVVRRVIAEVQALVEGHNPVPVLPKISPAEISYQW